MILLKEIPNITFYLFKELSSSGPGPGRVKVKCRSGEGQEGQSQVWVMWT